MGLQITWGMSFQNIETTRCITFSISRLKMISPEVIRAFFGKTFILFYGIAFLTTPSLHKLLIQQTFRYITWILLNLLSIWLHPQKRTRFTVPYLISRFDKFVSRQKIETVRILDCTIAIKKLFFSTACRHKIRTILRTMPYLKGRKISEGIFIFALSLNIQ